MKIHVKWIIIAIILIGFTLLFIFADRIEPGSVLAGLTTFIAALKSKLLGTTSFQKMISEIESSHQVNRDEWEMEKRDYDRQYDILKLKLDSLDNRTEILKQQLKETTNSDFRPNRRSEKEILEWLSRK
jgi:hypothetical protein